MDQMTASDLLDVFEDVPSTEVARSAFDGDGISVIDLIAEAGLTGSKGEARRLVRAGGASLNNCRVGDENERIGLDACIEGRLLVLRKGQKNYHLVRVV